MANNKQRYINTKLWNDTYVAKLDPIEKLLFVYLLTNEHTNISGVYELPFKIMAVETGIDESMFKKILPRLKEKIRYIEGIVVIKNFIKHQETGSPNVQKGILNCLTDLDINFLKNIVKQGYFILPKYYLDTLCIPYVEGRNYLDSNLDSNLDSTVAETTTWDFLKELEKLRTDKRKDLRLIAFYWKTKNWKFENKEQFNSALKRELRPAKSLIGYTGQQIAKAMSHCQNNYKEWGMETVVKRITDVINKKI